MPHKRGRGNRIIVYGRGSRSIEPSLPSPPHVQNPPHSSQSLHSEPQSPSIILSLGVTSTVQPIIGNGQSSTSNQLGDGGQSSATPTTEPQGSDPPLVPSSVDSRADRTARRNVLYVEPADDPKRFNDSKVNRDIISTVIMRMPNPAPVWKRYSEHMTTTLLNNFMLHQCHVLKCSASKHGTGAAEHDTDAADRTNVTQDGKYSLVLVFEAKALKLSDFKQRQKLKLNVEMLAKFISIESDSGLGMAMFSLG
ncbi:hypothetical protein RIF29_24879 [Crotalaria pallida]|uniref:Uncharacterized protein n=1 Tax=Crotalaria pallida TaxID=3830 RepID=A0AAN9EKI3_CROPI